MNLSMRKPGLFLAAVSLALSSCSSQPKPSAVEPPKKADAPKPSDETRRFPMINFVDSQVVGKELLGKPFMPGGTLAHYKKGRIEYDMFVAKLPSATGAAILLPDWQKALTNSKLIPSFGGYFGQDGARPVFVFAKDAWIAGVVGLSEKEADPQARALAAKLY